MYPQGVEYSNTETYEDLEIGKGFMTLDEFVKFLNKEFVQTRYGNKFERNNAVDMLKRGRLNKRYGGNRLEIRRANVVGVYQGVIVKVHGLILNTVKRKRKADPKSRLTYYHDYNTKK